MQELFETEKSYVESLDILVNVSYLKKTTSSHFLCTRKTINEHTLACLVFEKVSIFNVYMYVIFEVRVFFIFEKFSISLCRKGNYITKCCLTTDLSINNTRTVKSRNYA